MCTILVNKNGSCVYSGRCKLCRHKQCQLKRHFVFIHLSQECTQYSLYLLWIKGSNFANHFQCLAQTCCFFSMNCLELLVLYFSLHVFFTHKGLVDADVLNISDSKCS